MEPVSGATAKINTGTGRLTLQPLTKVVEVGGRVKVIIQNRGIQHRIVHACPRTGLIIVLGEEDKANIVSLLTQNGANIDTAHKCLRLDDVPIFVLSHEEAVKIREGLREKLSATSH